VKRPRHRAILIGASLMMLASGCATVGQPDTGAFADQQVAAMRSEGFARTDRGWELSVADRLLFATDRSDVRSGQASIIDHITRVLTGVGIHHVEVEGHTDKTGSVSYNDALSAKRASAVAEVMAASGMPHDGIKVVGLGDRYPVESNRTATGRRENRRVVILVTAP